MISIRKLELKDSEKMLEWMHDTDIQKCFQKSFKDMTMENVKCFIRKSSVFPVDGGDIHFAIVDESDEYLGTISLKHISMSEKKAEYAICLRKDAQGKGIAVQATNVLLKKAFREWGLEKIILNVLSDNCRAINFYEKFGFVFEKEEQHSILINDEFKCLRWYCVLKADYEARNIS